MKVSYFNIAVFLHPHCLRRLLWRHTLKCVGRCSWCLNSPLFTHRKIQPPKQPHAQLFIPQTLIKTMSGHRRDGMCFIAFHKGRRLSNSCQFSPPTPKSGAPSSWEGWNGFTWPSVDIVMLSSCYAGPVSKAEWILDELKLAVPFPNLHGQVLLYRHMFLIKECLVVCCQDVSQSERERCVMHKV